MFSQIMCNSTHACITKNTTLERQKVNMKHVRCSETGCDSYYNKMYWIFFIQIHFLGVNLLGIRLHNHG